MTDESKVKAVMESLDARKLRCAKAIDGRLFLTNVSTLANTTYLHPQNFLEELEKEGMTLNPKTLDIVKNVKKSPAPKPVETPKTLDTWTKAELDNLDYDDIRGLTKKFDDIKGNWGKDKIVAALVGKPK